MMLDNKDKDALATLLLGGLLVCAGCLLFAVVLGESIHLLRYFGGV